ncbi:MAG: patatin-like phospholipase family protein [Chloroflexi bacterium]|nr:patatin-like phospholipase family protein [Chloroflexota bacterium]
MSNARKIALVIGWGSVKCAAALGVLRVLHRAGIQIDLLVGGGGGSIYAGLAALGHTADEIVEMNARLWTREVTEQPNRLAPLQLLFPRQFKAREFFYLRGDRLVNQRLQAAFGERTFADCTIPLFITATDYLTGEQVTLTDGPLWEAVRASIALPLVFAPVRRGGRLLADGYLSDPLPVGVAMREGAQIILALGFESTPILPLDTFGKFVFHIQSVMTDNLLKASYSFHNMAHHAEVLPIFPDFERPIHQFDTQAVPHIIEVGERAGEKILPALQRLLEGG